MPRRRLWLALTGPHLVQAQQGAKGGAKGGSRFTQDPRVETRTYHSADTNEELPYSLDVSTKVKNDTPAPLIVTLHGLGATQTIMMAKEAVDHAEAGGYILVSPLGYNTSGWYGALGPGRGFGGRGKGGDAKGGDAKGGEAKGKGGVGAANQPENLGELSENDVMNVVAMVRKEFNVDAKRMYVMSHSMGGAGTLYMGAAYSDLWAAVGAAAPAPPDQAHWLRKKLPSCLRSR